MLKSAKLTGLWENKLRRIERKEYDPATFIAELKTLIQEIVFNVLSDNSRRNITVEEEQKTKGKAKEKPVKKTAKTKNESKEPEITSYRQVICPVCKKGHILKGKKAFGCSEYANGCKLILPFAQYPENDTPAELARKLDNYKANT